MRSREEVALWSALVLCMGSGPLLVFILVAVSPLVIADLGLTPTQYGAIVSVTYGSAALGAFLLGGPAGRMDARRLMAAICFGSGLGLLVVSMAQSYLLVVVAASLSGVAQALSNPATNRVVAGLPFERQGALVGWKQSGVQLAQLTAGLTAPLIATAVGWRWAAAAGVVFAAVGVGTSLSIRADGLRPGSVQTAQAAQGGVSVRTLAAYTFFMACGLQTTTAYLPLFANRVLEFDAAVAGLTSAVVGGIGLASRIWWARAAHCDGARPARFRLLAAGAGAGVALVLAATVVGGWLLWCGVGLFGAAALASNAVTMVALVQSVPPQQLVAATSKIVTGMYIGFAVGPPSFGLLLEWRNGFGAAWLLPMTAFAIAALITAKWSAARCTPATRLVTGG